MSGMGSLGLLILAGLGLVVLVVVVLTVAAWRPARPGGSPRARLVDLALLLAGALVCLNLALEFAFLNQGTSWFLGIVAALAVLQAARLGVALVRSRQRAAIAAVGVMAALSVALQGFLSWFEIREALSSSYAPPPTEELEDQEALPLEDEPPP
ncbi:MAG: hypothetical protein HY901_04390 [Deltaproteobacteria bacterium]|nr:hypothetical protein [Deltaproteobacteria bacterium]